MKRYQRMAAALISVAMMTALLPLSSVAAEEPTKDETVFITLNPDGSIKSQVVSAWLHADSGVSNVKDQSSLTDIINLKTGEKPEIQGKTLSWSDVSGNDVYYQGTTEKKPPVTAKITYALNGAQISPENLVGKSGRLGITVQLQNGLTETRSIAGSNRRIYSPLMCLVGTNLSTDHYGNIVAEHGTVETDSSNQLVGYVLLPGMSESFDGLLTGKFDSLKNNLLDTVTLEADITDLDALPTIYIACATNVDLLKEDINFQDFDRLFSDLDELDDGITELVNGCNTLMDGADTLNTGAADLDKGAQTLDAGVGVLQTGVASLDSGAKKLYAGLSQLSGNNADLSNNLDAIFAGVVSSVNAGLRASLMQNAETEAATNLSNLIGGSFTLTLDNYASVIGEKRARLSGAHQAGSLDDSSYHALDGLFGKAKQEMDQLKQLDESITDTQSLLLSLMLPDTTETETTVPTEPVPSDSSATENAAESPSKAVEGASGSNTPDGTVSDGTTAAGSETSKPAAGGSTDAPSSTEPASDSSSASNASGESSKGAESSSPAPEGAPTETNGAPTPATSETGNVEPQVSYSLQTGVVRLGNMAMRTSDLNVVQFDAVAPTAQEQHALVSSIVKSVSDSLNSTLSLTFQTKADDKINSALSALTNAGALPLTLSDYEAQIQTISSALGVSESGFSSVKGTLSGLAAYKKGLGDYLDGVNLAKSGADDLIKGIEDKLAPGANQLKSGTEALVDGTKQLSDGTQSLVSGVRELVDGVNELSSRVRENLTSSEDVDHLRSILDVLQALRDMKEQVTGYGAPENAATTLKYVMKTA